MNISPQTPVRAVPGGIWKHISATGAIAALLFGLLIAEPVYFRD